MADRKISELPLFPHHEVIQNSDVYYVVASGLASETRDATNYRVSFTGLANDILRNFGGGASIIDADGSIIRIGSIEPGDDRPVELQDDVYVLGDLYAESDLHVDGNAFFDQNVSITGGISASGDADFIDLYVHGNAFVKHDTIISGDLTVLGNTTTIDTERLVIEDNNIEIGSHPSPSDLTADGGGITLVASNDGLTDKKIYWELDEDAWTFNTNINIEGSGNFSQGIHLATDQLIGGIKVGLDSDPTNYGGLVMDGGYLKIEDWSAGGEAALWVSDINLKDNRKKIDSATEILNQINGIYFTWNESAHASLTGKKDIGVIAQEVQAVLPEIVAENTAGNLAVSYHKIIPVLIESIKELSQENKLLKSRIDRLESKQ